MCCLWFGFGFGGTVKGRGFCNEPVELQRLRLFSGSRSMVTHAQFGRQAATQSLRAAIRSSSSPGPRTHTRGAKLQEPMSERPGNQVNDMGREVTEAAAAPSPPPSSNKASSRIIPDKSPSWDQSAA